MAGVLEFLLGASTPICLGLHVSRGNADRRGLLKKVRDS